MLATWVLVFLAYTAVWKASRELGLATWWLGPTAEPRPFPVLLVPFVAPLAMMIATINNSRRLPWYGLAAAAVGVAIAIGDLGTFRRLGLVELGIAVAAGAVSVASMAGQYRAAASRQPESHGIARWASAAAQRRQRARQVSRAACLRDEPDSVGSLGVGRDATKILTTLPRR